MILADRPSVMRWWDSNSSEALKYRVLKMSERAAILARIQTSEAARRSPHPVLLRRAQKLCVSFV